MPTLICMADHIFDGTEPNAQRRENGDVWEDSQQFVDDVLAGDEAAGRKPRIKVLDLAALQPKDKTPKYGGMNPGPGRGRKRKVTYEESPPEAPEADDDEDQ